MELWALIDRSATDTVRRSLGDFEVYLGETPARDAFAAVLRDEPDWRTTSTWSLSGASSSRRTRPPRRTAYTRIRLGRSSWVWKSAKVG
jgi:hypothetical protein